MTSTVQPFLSCQRLIQTDANTAQDDISPPQVIDRIAHLCWYPVTTHVGDSELDRLYIPVNYFSQADEFLSCGSWQTSPGAEPLRDDVLP